MESNQEKQKIVIVEDNKALSEIYKTRLEMLGYTCFVANDGIAALYLIQNELPSLVLLDLMVPAVAGDEILKRMRASEWGKNIPVFIISNLNETEAPAGLRELNIVGYVVKANLADDGLDKIVNSILRPSEQQPPLPTANANIAIQPEIPVTAPSQEPNETAQATPAVLSAPPQTTPTIAPLDPALPPQFEPPSQPVTAQPTPPSNAPPAPSI